MDPLSLDIGGEHETGSERPTSPLRLLTRHFLRRFLDNDLISPNADRHETLTVGATLLISTGLFVSVLIASKYVMNPFPTPVHMALGSMQDRCLFVGASMVAMALVALAQWDALSIDARDAAILGVLPVSRQVIVLAKLTALGVFTAAFAVIMNVGSAVLFPLFFAAQLPLGLVDLVRMIAAHALVTLAAGAFGMAGVVAVREVLRAVLGARLFGRVSTFVQATLVVLAGTALLILPGVANRAVRTMVERPTTALDALPPLWFVGLHEVLVGDTITRVHGRRVPGVIRAREREAVERYRANAPHFRRLAATAVPALASVMGLALAAFLWNHRRLPHGVPQRASRRRVWRRVASRLLERGMAPAPTAQAGFFFTLQVLPRSAAHRVVMSSTLAAGLASLVAAFSGVALTGIDGPPARLGVWAAQTLLLAAVLCGLRHAVRVPAELKASSSFLIAWSGDEREYLSGVKRAALTALALPVIVVMLPLHVILLGPRLAMLHALCGLAIAVVLLDALTCGLRRLPFVCAYVAAGSFKRAAPIFLAGGLVGCYAFAGIERAASQRALGVAALIAVLGLVAWLLRWWGRAGRHDAPDLDIDLAPDAVVTMDLRG